MSFTLITLTAGAAVGKTGTLNGSIILGATSLSYTLTGGTAPLANQTYSIDDGLATQEFITPSVVTGAGPYTFTVPATQFAHTSGAVIKGVGYRNADGSVAKGTVTFQATAEMENGGQIRSPSIVTAQLDNNGEIKIGGQGGTAVILAATDDTGTLPTGVTYTVTENLQGAPTRVWQLAVPKAVSPLDLSTVAPALPATPAFGYALDSAVIHNTGVESVAGAKTFTGNVSFPRMRTSIGPWIDPMHPTFGGTGDGTTGDDGPIQAAIDALPSSGGVVDLRNAPSNAWKLNAGLTNRGTRLVQLLGGGSGSQPGAGTRLNVAAGIIGITFLNGSGGMGARSRAESLHLVGSDSAPGTNDGILLQCNEGQLVDITAEGFGQYGVNIDSSAGDTTHNANNWMAQQIRVFGNKTGGWHSVGANSNAGSCYGLDCDTNTGFGLYENSTLGGNYFGVHLAGNTVGGIRIGTSGKNNRMYGVYFESENKPALQLDAGASSNFIDFSNCSRPDATSPIVDNSGGAVNFIVLQQAGLHFRRFIVSGDAAGGAQIDVNGTASPIELAFLLGAQAHFQNNPVTANWYLSVLGDGRLNWASAQPYDMLCPNAFQANGFKSGLTGGGKMSQGSGAPSTPNGVNPVAGDIWFRTDTPSTANQRVYICTVGGGSPTWVGIV